MNEPVDTRTRLLDAARRLFAERGYMGTSIKAITDAAGANLGAVTYHFKTKDALYDAVVRSLTEPLVATVEDALRSGGAPIDRIEAALRAYSEYMHTREEVPSLLLQELALNRPILTPIRETIGPLLRGIASVIAEGQRDGSIVAGDPLLLTISTMSQSAFLVVMRRPVNEIAGVNMLDATMRRRMVDHIVTIVRRGLVVVNGGRS
ncbi:MAG: TetR family transcriptional regulator [candidate division Zixibacteria bacterium]|nr:TetR family transcriptional regulator [candidate division Zixibacteria bacterium]